MERWPRKCPECGRKNTLVRSIQGRMICSQGRGGCEHVIYPKSKEEW